MPISSLDGSGEGMAKAVMNKVPHICLLPPWGLQSRSWHGDCSSCTMVTRGDFASRALPGYGWWWRGWGPVLWGDEATLLWDGDAAACFGSPSPAHHHHRKKKHL